MVDRDAIHISHISSRRVRSSFFSAKGVLEEIFSVGTGHPSGVPLPVVKRIICAPDAASAQAAVKSFPGP